MEKFQLTEEGYKKLESELDILIHEDSVKTKEELEEARAQGDLSENADYTAAKSRLADINSRIEEIQNILHNSEIIKKTKSKGIGIGSVVVIKDLEENEEYTYQIVSTIETDVDNGKISNVSPLGEALLGKKKGDIVDVPAKINYSVEILDIK